MTIENTLSKVADSIAKDAIVNNDMNTQLFLDIHKNGMSAGEQYFGQQFAQRIAHYAADEIISNNQQTNDNVFHKVNNAITPLLPPEQALCWSNLKGKLAENGINITSVFETQLGNITKPKNKPF